MEVTTKDGREWATLKDENGGVYCCAITGNILPNGEPCLLIGDGVTARAFSRSLAIDLIAHLSAWVETGSLRVETEEEIAIASREREFVSSGIVYRPAPSEAACLCNGCDLPYGTPECEGAPPCCETERQDRRDIVWKRAGTAGEGGEG